MVGRVMSVLAMLDALGFAVMSLTFALMGEGFIAILLTPCVGIGAFMSKMMWEG